MRMGTNRARRAFTLIEILIVVVILGILAAIVIPQFTDAADDAAANAAQSTLQTVRSQIELYKFKESVADTAIDDFTGLVNNNYLQAAPTADGYCFSVTDGVVTVTTDPNGDGDCSDGAATGW